MPELETDIVLSAIRRGEDSLPKLRTATGLDYAKLHPVLHELEFEWKSINSRETADGFQRFTPTSSEKSNGGSGKPTGSKGGPAPTTPPQALRQTKASVSARDMALLQRDAPYCVTCRGLCLFDGLDLENRPHWRCQSCGVTFEGTSVQVEPVAHIDPHKEAEAKISAMIERGRVSPDARQGPTYKPLDLAEVEEIMATEETIAKGAAKLGLTNMQLYTRRQRDKAVEAAVARGRDRYYEALDANEEKENAEPALQPEQPKTLPENLQESPQNITKTITNTETTRVLETEQPARAQAVSPDISEDKNMSVAESPVSNETLKRAVAKERDIIPEKFHSQDTQMVTRTSEIHGSLVLREEVQLKVEEIAQWPPERIAEFFEAVSKVVNIPTRTFPTKIRRAWSKSFEDDNEEGMPALTMLYLISLLHEGMEEHEKQAVWVLVLYCKRVQAAAEAAREAKKGEQK